MKKNIIKSLLLLIMISLFIINPKVEAASASISASKTNAYVGDKVTITVTSKAGAWNLSVSGSGINDSIVGYDMDGNKTTSKTYTLNTSKAGTYTVTLKGDITDYDTEATSNINKSVTVTVKAKPATTQTKPTTTTTTPKQTTPTPTPKPEVVEPIKISKFEIVGYNIDFNNDKTEYEIEVDKDVTKLYLIVEGNSITTTGDKAVDIKDKNEITVKVTKKTLSKEYKIKINRKKDKEEIKQEIEEEIRKKVEEEIKAATKPIEAKEEKIDNKSSNTFLITTIVLGVIAICELAYILIKSNKKNLEVK